MKKNKRNLVISAVASSLLIGAMYSYQKWAVAAEINPQKVVYTKKDIPPRTKITKDMVEVYEVPGRTVPPNAIRDVNQVIGKWTSEGYGLSSNSLVFKDKVVKTDELPDAGVLKLKKNEQSFPLLVDIETSLGNSIMPDTYVDLYFKTIVKESKDGKEVLKPIFAKVASHVRVTAAKDGEAINVFDQADTTNSENTTDKNKRPLTKLYIFGVTSEQNEILNKGKMIGQIVPIANGKSYVSKVGENELETKEMIEWIESQSYKSENN